MNPEQQVTGPAPRVQRLIRIAMGGGLLVFGVLVGVLRTGGSFEGALEAEVLGAFRLVIFLVALMNLGTMLFFRSRRMQSADPSQRATFAIIGWALAEGVALLGAIYWLLGGGPLLFVAGMLLFGLAWLLFPITDAG